MLAGNVNVKLLPKNDPYLTKLALLDNDKLFIEANHAAHLSRRNRGEPDSAYHKMKNLVLEELKRREVN